MSSPTDPTNDPFEKQLRQLLKAEADTVSPSPEALNMIRERTERHRSAAWFGLPWLRPAAAVAGAVMIAASVIMSSPQVRDQVLEFVPAGADRSGTPPEQEDGGDVAVPDPTTDSDDGAARPQGKPEKDPPSSPSPDDEASSTDDELESTATCTPVEDTPSSTPGTAEETEKESPERPVPGNDCVPSDDPTDGGAADGGDGGGEAPGDGGGEVPDNGGDDGSEEGTGGSGDGGGGTEEGTGGDGTGSTSSGTGSAGDTSKTVTEE